MSDEGGTGGPGHRTPVWRRVPRQLFGGRVRTTTAALILVFIGCLLLYGQASTHYEQVDRDKQAADVQRSARLAEPPTTSTRRTPTPSPTSTWTAPSTSESQSPTSEATTPDTVGETDTPTTTAPSATTENRNPFPFPFQNPQTTTTTRR